MLAAQMAVIHTATMTFARRLAMVRAARHAPRDVGRRGDAGLRVCAVQLPLTLFDNDVATVKRALALEDGPRCSLNIPMAERSSPKRATIQKSATV
jgi:hypothetical protein